MNRPQAATKNGASKFEDVDCLICGSKDFRTFCKVADRLAIRSGQRFAIAQCLKCSFVFLNPRPTADSISNYYQSSGYQPFLSAQKPRSLLDAIYALTRKYTVLNKRRKIEALKQKGKLLDIGCGTGEFLHEMGSHGWQVEGMEKDEQAADYAHKTYGISVSTKDLEENYYLEKSFDVVTLWHVLEHLHEPQRILGIAKELLKDDGVILIAVPNVASVDSRFYGTDWVALDAPRHLYHFTPDALSALASALALRVVAIQQMPIDAFYNCLMSELFLIESMSRTRLLLPFFLIRAFLLAATSIACSTRLRAPLRRQGSSVLYFLEKSET